MIRVGLVGVGGMGSGHLSQYLRLMKEGSDIRLVAICDINPAQLERKVNNDLNIRLEKTEYQAELNKYTDYKEMIEKEELDYVDSALPTYLHAQFAIYAMERGLHVLSEKPMALTLNECENMIEASFRTGKQLMIGQCLRFWPMYEELKKLVDSGAWGRVLSGHFYRGSATPKWSYENWMMDEKRSGGLLLDQHVHDVDMIRYLFGTPKFVSTSSLNVLPGTGSDALSTNYFYADGTVINAMDDWCMMGQDYGFEMGYRVNFEKGVAVLNNEGLTLYPESGAAYRPELDPDDGYYREILYFAKCLRENAPVTVCSPQSTMETIRIALAEAESARRGGEKVAL